MTSSHLHLPGHDCFHFSHGMNVCLRYLRYFCADILTVNYENYFDCQRFAYDSREWPSFV